jgi:hypothetical protein
MLKVKQVQAKSLMLLSQPQTTVTNLKEDLLGKTKKVWMKVIGHSKSL